MAPFRFKHFQVCHDKSALKVGVDGVLIGAWTGHCLQNENLFVDRILDAGCGCGLIALMIAQHQPHALIDALDFHHDSVEEASYNFNNSPWGPRLNAIESDICTFTELLSNRGVYDLIVSNPPFFNSGVCPKESARQFARHQGTLSPRSLIHFSNHLLKNAGRLFLIAPFGQKEELLDECRVAKMYPKRVCEVQDSVLKLPKRIMLEVSKSWNSEAVAKFDDYIVEKLSLREPDGKYSEDYKKLTGDFYLDF